MSFNPYFNLDGSFTNQIMNAPPKPSFTDSLGKASGELGAIISLFNGVASLFAGGSKPKAFAEAGKLFLGSWITQIKTSNSNNPSVMLTEMSKAYNYMLLHYQAHLSGSTSSRSKTGNKMGMDYVKQFEPIFKKAISGLRTSFTINSSQVPYTYPKNFYSGIKSFHGNHSGYYTEFVLTPKPTLAEKIISKSDETNLMGSSNNPLLILLLIVISIPLFKKFKF